MSLVWCLSVLRKREHQIASFFFDGPLDIYRGFDSYDQRKKEHEADIVCVTNGKVRLVEVKQSLRNTTDKEIEKLAKLAAFVKPDIATLAIMTDASDATSRRLKKLSDELEGTGIQAELITIDRRFDLSEYP